MCGIAGIIPATSTSISGDLLARMSQRLEHRGPDDRGCLVFTAGRCNVTLAPPAMAVPADAILLHRRLSILDLSPAGRQPMGTPDGRYFVVFNGEIYNYLELRSELEQAGVRFRSHSDTEVLLHAYIHWGPQCLHRLTGMFAFAILDTRDRLVFLARDFFGIKPLYYTRSSAGFAFASQISALLEFPGVGRDVDSARLYLYLRYGLTDHGSDTLFADIHQLPAGHYIQIPLDNPDANTVVHYWRPDREARIDVSFEEAARRMREVFLNNVKLHLRSDVPVGACLSGGIDSSSIVMAMRHIQGPTLDLHTFGYIGDDPAIDEEAWIDRVSTAAGAVCHKTRPAATDLLEDVAELIRSQEEPFGGTSIFAQRCVFRLAREAGVKVLLDGQGADELLGGYRTYLAARLASLVRQGKLGEAIAFLQRSSRLPGSGGRRLPLQAIGLLLPKRWRDQLRSCVGEDLVPPWLDRGWFADRGVRPTSLGENTTSELLREALWRTFSETGLPMLLRYEDRNSMAFSLESRVPFLTPEFVELCLGLPESYIIDRDGTSKAVFRAAMRGLVPDAVLDRRDKIGFATPEQRWLDTLAPWFDRVLSSEAANAIPALDLSRVHHEWQAVRAGRKRFDLRVWRWVNLICWTDRFNVSFQS